MKTAIALAMLGASLAATPVLAQEMPSGSSEEQSRQQMQAPEQGTMPQRGGIMSGSASGRQHVAMNRDTVRNIQQALEQKGYNIGQVDGQLGPRTRQALQQFQRDEGLQSSGRIDQQTMAALGVEAGGPQQAQTPEPGGRSQQQQLQPRFQPGEQMNR